MATTSAGQDPPQPPPDPPAVGELAVEDEANEFLDAVCKAATAGKRRAVANHIDINRMIDECVRPTGIQLNYFQRVALRLLFRSEMSDAIIDLFEDSKRFEVRRMFVDVDNATANAVVRITDQDDIRVYVRFWMAKENSKWKWYDFEEQDIGLRLSVLFAQLAQETANQRPTDFNFRWIEQAADAIDSGDFDKAHELIAAAERKRYPPIIRAILLTLKCSLLIEEDEFDEALVVVDEALKLRPDFPVLHYLRSTLLLNNEDYEAAIAEAKIFMAAIGPDPDAYFVIGIALGALNRNEEALQAHRHALDDCPDALDNLTALARLLPPENKQELVERFFAMPDHAERFEEVASLLEDDSDDFSLKALALAWRERAPQDPNGIYYLAQAYMMSENYAAAAEILPSAFAVAPAEEREYYIDMFLRAMLELDKAVEAYQQVPEKQMAFEFLASELIQVDRDDEARRLVELHRKDFPDDPHIPYYEGDIYYFQDQFEQADQFYARAQELRPDEELSELIRSSRVLCWCNLGKGLEAYEQFPPKKDTFEQLAEHFMSTKEIESLKQLVARHEAQVGMTSEVKEWRVRTYWLQQDYEGVIKQIEQFGDALTAQEVSAIESMWIRSLVHLKKFDQALQQAKHYTNRDGNPYFELLVHASKGDVEQTSGLLPKVLEFGWSFSSLLEDEEMGPALRADRFKELRDKYEADAANEAAEEQLEETTEAAVPE